MESSNTLPPYRDESAAALRKSVCEAARVEDTEANAEEALRVLQEREPKKLMELVKLHGSFTDNAIAQVG